MFGEAGQLVASQSAAGRRQTLLHPARRSCLSSAMFIPPQSLVHAVRQRTLVPFVGAGLSVGVVHGLNPEYQFPNWEGLIRLLARRLEAQDPIAAAQALSLLPDTMAAAQRIADTLERTAFLDVMAGTFGRERRPPRADLSTVDAVWRLRTPFVITTNYDLVLEWPLGLTEAERIHNDDPTPLMNLDRADYPKKRIWHLHGSIKRIDTVILTSKQYERLYPEGVADEKRREYQNAFNRLQGFLTNRHFLFLGFSLTEPVLRRKLEDVLALTARATPIKFLLLVKGEADEAKKREFLERYNVQVLEFDDFGAPAVEAIDAIGRTAWSASLVVSRSGLTPQLEPLVDGLLEQITGLSLPPATIARLFNATKPESWPVALTGGDGISQLHEAIVQLGKALTSSDTGVPPLLALVNRLIDESTAPWSMRLRAWLQDAVEFIARDEAARGRLVAQLAAARQASRAAPTHVLVRIASADSASGEWLVHAWSWIGANVPDALFGPEGRRFKSGDSAALVFDLVDELEARSVDPELTTIAFLVPSALACEPIHDWRLAEEVPGDPPIGASYTVTVRPLERLRNPIVRRRLKRAWDELKRRATEMLTVLDPNATVAPAAVGAMFLDTAGALRRDLGETIEKRGVRCIVLRQPPSASDLTHLSAVLQTTAPAILWRRDRPGDPAADQELRDLLEGGAVVELPKRIRDGRYEAFRDEPPAGANAGMSVTLIWDDADYLPPEQDPQARAKIETI